MCRVASASESTRPVLRRGETPEWSVNDSEQGGLDCLNLECYQWNFLRNPPLVVWCCETRGGDFLKTASNPQNFSRLRRGFWSNIHCNYTPKWRFWCYCAPQANFFSISDAFLSDFPLKNNISNGFCIKFPQNFPRAFGPDVAKQGGISQRGGYLKNFHWWVM